MTRQQLRGFLVRPMLSADLPELTDLWVAAWAETFPAIDFEARRGWFIDRVVAFSERGVAVLVALDRATGRMAGFVTFDPAAHWLDQIAAAPAYAGSGVADTLMDAVQAMAGGLISLDVNADNARALRFYRNRGFVVRGEGRNAQSGLKTLSLQWKLLDLAAR